MSTLSHVHCDDCGWTGTESDLDNSTGEPACPDCSANIRI